MKRTLVLLLALGLLAGGALWYSAAGTEKVRIRRMAEEQEEALGELVRLCQTVQGIGRWEMLPDNMPHDYVLRDGNMEERPLASPCGEQIAEVCEAVFEEYPFNGVYAVYDDAEHFRINFYQTKRDGDRYIKYYLIYIDPAYEAGFYDSFYGAVQDGYAQENCRLFGDWYCWSESMADIY